MNAPTSMLEIVSAVLPPIQPQYTPEPKRGARRTAHRRAGTLFGQLQGSRSPFKRALHHIELIQAIVLKGLKPLERQAELDALPPQRRAGIPVTLKHPPREPMGALRRLVHWLLGWGR